MQLPGDALRGEFKVQVVDIVDGPLCKEEFDLIAQALQDSARTVTAGFDDKAMFEDIAKNVVRWRHVLSSADEVSTPASLISDLLPFCDDLASADVSIWMFEKES